MEPWEYPAVRNGDLTTTAAGTSFGATTVGGNLGVTASGVVADTGKLEITGTTGITATGQTVTLDDSTNEFGGTVTAVAGATTLKDADSLVAVLNTTGTTDLTAVGTWEYPAVLPVILQPLQQERALEQQP